MGDRPFEEVVTHLRSDVHHGSCQGCDREAAVPGPVGGGEGEPAGYEPLGLPLDLTRRSYPGRIPASSREVPHGGGCALYEDGVGTAVEDRGFAEASIAEVSRLREDLFGALAALPGLRPYPGAANFVLVRGPEGLPGRLARRGVLVRGCGPFYGLGPEYFRVAVRGAQENRQLLAAIREEL